MAGHGDARPLRRAPPGSTSATATSAPTCSAPSGSTRAPPLTEVTAEIARGWDLELALLPATDDALRTRVTVLDPDPAVPGATIEREVGFQEYFVQRQHGVPVTAVRFDGADAARPGPEVLASIAGADAVVIAPSNPIVSIGPVLAVPGIRGRRGPP